MNPAFWRGRRVFLTGHTGFKGAWLALWLHHMGAELTGFALPPATQPNLFDAAGVAGLVHSVTGDINDATALRAAMAMARPEVVLHLAAQALVRPSYDDPLGTFATNVMGTAHLCQAVRQVGGVRAVVCVTSDKCYDNREWDWPYRESDPMGGHDPYSASKGCAELVAASFRASYFAPERHAEHGVGLATARAGNVIGGGDWSAERLLPDLLRAQAGGQTVHIRQPDAVRPWQHVLDALAGYLLLAQRLCEDGPRHAGAWNFGPSEADACSVRQLVAAVTRRLPLAVQMADKPAQHAPHEAGLLRLDSSKARQRLGWQPAWTLADALDRVLDWHQGWQDQTAAQDLCRQQIAAHGKALTRQ